MKRQKPIVRNANYFTKLFIAAIACMILLAGCTSAKPPVESNNANNTASSTPTDTPAAPSPTANDSDNNPSTPVDELQQKINHMSLSDKISQLMIIGIEGTELDQNAEAMLKKHIGGFILYKKNISSPEQTWTLLNELKKQNSDSAVPIWLAVDQEGGKVSRMPSSFIPIPTPEKIGQTENSEYAYRTGQALGLEVNSLGFNLDFAPVVDINSNPKNPVIGNRSYGSTPEQAAKYAVEAMKGIQSENVATSIKHFPGHGDTNVDSHYDLPVISKTKSELESFELKPFVHAIEENVDTIMVGHLLVPDIDDQNPASLSKEIITNWLRGELQYDGVVITDDMTMGGITKHRDIAEAAVQSILAGTDIVLIGHDPQMQLNVWEKLYEAAQNGTLPEEQINKSVERILLLKQKYNLSDEATVKFDQEALNNKVDSLLNQ